MDCATPGGGGRGRKGLGLSALSLVLLIPGSARPGTCAYYSPEVTAASGPEAPEEAGVRRLLADYARAIESKDLTLFRSVKPNLTKDEEVRLQKAFASVHTQLVKITIQSIQLGSGQATVRVSRRDTIDSSTIASFPQTLLLDHGAGGWTIREIGR
jgi:hypothetical protein